MEKGGRRFLKVSEFAEALNCSRSKAYEIAASGEVKTVKIAGLLRIPSEELDRLAGAAALNERAD